MKILNFINDNQQTLGIKTEKGIIDIEKALTIQPNENISSNIMDIIQGGEPVITELESYIEELPQDKYYMVAESDISFGPAVPSPNKIICVGLNYQKHADETGSPYPETPILFTKYNNTLTGHKQNIAVPKVTKKLDYEVELGIVIGKKTKDVEKEEALDHVFGYVIANDLSARDLQFVSSQWLLGKSCDDFTPIGPYLVTRNEVDNPNNLYLKTFVNGEERQNSNTSDMIFHCNEIISYISKYMTLTPGDVVLTGTPEGVVMGMPEDKQVYIQPGDEVTVEIEKLGRLTSQFIKDK
ncbi:fumarylacetoacetate hydrolase family protein [Virgibacillus sp. W0430]|uniref:fumarylacetoacetate hydrolase family protein n=1 Tax=Virgibacillus sp. W0430 TaxID=3391580 RepID=UPI003F44B861